MLDIDASLEKRTISFDFVEALASFTSVPLTVGGGVSNLSQIKQLLSYGVEKVVLSSKISNNLNLLRNAANQFGSSSISVIINTNYNSDNEPCAYLGRPEIGKPKPLESIAREIQNSGAGELIINNIEREGTRMGFDIKMMEKLNNELTIPIVALGGCGHLKHIKELLSSTPINGIACGTFFVYGNNQQEVLLNYVDKANWLNNNFQSLIKR